jgi:hypothetical protein
MLELAKDHISRIQVKPRSIFRLRHLTLSRKSLLTLIADCKVVATLKPDLSSVSKSEFELVTSKKSEYYKVSYDIEMSFEATMAFRLLFGGTYLLILNSNVFESLPS